MRKKPGILHKNLKIEHSLWKANISKIAGVDEAGRGPLAGPVVAAAVVFPQYEYIPAVRDSKKLSPRRRQELFELIVCKATAFGIGIIDNGVVDKINIRQATLLAMKEAVSKLRCGADYLLIDGRDTLEIALPQKAIVRGDDKSFTISAASIIAKVTRDRIMVDYHKTYPHYGFDHHKGYATLFHREMIKKFGPCPIHRRTFLSRIWME